MKKTLGKIFILLLLSTTLFAGVKAFVNKDTIYSGDNVNYTISIDGENPEFPNLNKIAGYGVLGVSTSQSVNIINGVYKSTTSKSYAFAPTKSVNIPSYEVSVDGKQYKTNVVSVKVVKPTVSKSGGNFFINMSMDKNDVYVGEPIKLDVKFKYKLSAKADQVTLSPLKISDFWIKSSGKPIKSVEKDFVVQTYHYLIFPQKQGDFVVNPVEANIGTVRRENMGGNIFNNPFIDSFDQTIKWKKYLSNKLYIHVKPLPNNLEVFGLFNIKASVDKTVTKANKPVNLTIKIEGLGNVDDIKKFAIDMADVVVYSDEPVIKSGISDGKYGGVFTQKIALIADKDFVIPSLKFSYFDKDLKKVVIKETKPISIKVEGGAKREIAPKIDSKNTIKINEKPQVVQKIMVSKSSNYLYLLLGFVLGILVTLGFIMVGKKDKTKKEIPIIKKIKKAKNDKELFDVLLPYGKNDDFIKSVLETLEENIYGKSKTKINKKEIVIHFLDIQ